MREGLEPELSGGLDVMYPMKAVTHRSVPAARLSAYALGMYVEALGGVVQPVLDGSCRIGVIGSLPNRAGGLRRRAWSLSLSPPWCARNISQPRGAGCCRTRSWQVTCSGAERICTALSAGRTFGVVSPLTGLATSAPSMNSCSRASAGESMPVQWCRQLDRGNWWKSARRQTGAARRMAMLGGYRKDSSAGGVGGLHRGVED
jgi:hypothetical protein